MPSELYGHGNTRLLCAKRAASSLVASTVRVYGYRSNSFDRTPSNAIERKRTEANAIERDRTRQRSITDLAGKSSSSIASKSPLPSRFRRPRPHLSLTILHAPAGGKGRERLDIPFPCVTLALIILAVFMYREPAGICGKCLWMERWNNVNDGGFCSILVRGEAERPNFSMSMQLELKSRCG